MLNIDPLTALTVFLATALSDVAWVFYIRRTTQGKAIQSSFFSAIIYILGGYVIVSYVHNIAYLIPVAFGTFTGTYLTIKYDAKKIRHHFKKHLKRRH